MALKADISTRNLTILHACCLLAWLGIDPNTRLFAWLELAPNPRLLAWLELALT